MARRLVIAAAGFMACLPARAEEVVAAWSVTNLARWIYRQTPAIVIAGDGAPSLAIGPDDRLESETLPDMEPFTVYALRLTLSGDPRTRLHAGLAETHGSLLGLKEPRPLVDLPMLPRAPGLQTLESRFATGGEPLCRRLLLRAVPARYPAGRRGLHLREVQLVRIEPVRPPSPGGVVLEQTFDRGEAGGYRVGGSGTCATERTTVHGGAQALRMMNDQRLFMGTVRVEPWVTYRMSAWVRGSGEFGFVLLNYLDERGPAGQFAGWTEYHTISVTNAWQRVAAECIGRPVSRPLILPATWVNFGLLTSKGADVIVDDFRVEALRPATAGTTERPVSPLQLCP